MKTRDRVYGIGVILTVLGAAGIAEHITSSRGSFIISALVFSIGFGCVLYGYMK